MGRFAGAAGAADRIASLADAALAVDAPHGGTVPADGLYELIEVGATTMSAPVDAALDGPWERLRAACRDVLDEPGDPVAAIALLVDEGGRLRLVHRGHDRIRVGLGGVVSVMTTYRADGSTPSVSRRTADGIVDGGPGWQLPIDLDPPDAADGRVVASVAFTLDDGGVWIPVRCEMVAPA